MQSQSTYLANLGGEIDIRFHPQDYYGPNEKWSAHLECNGKSVAVQVKVEAATLEGVLDALFKAVSDTQDFGLPGDVFQAALPSSSNPPESEWTDEQRQTLEDPRPNVRPEVGKSWEADDDLPF